MIDRVSDAPAPPRPPGRPSGARHVDGARRPQLRPLPRRLRRRRDQGRTAGRRWSAEHGLEGPARRCRPVVEARQPEQTHDRARREGPRRPHDRSSASSTTPTSWSRTPGRGRWSDSGWVPRSCLERRPSLVMTRVSGFGQTGPYAERPGFATIAEAMSGFAALNGEPEGAPLLPPIALTDEVTGLAAAFATMVALHSGVGQVVDANLLETMFHLMGPLRRCTRSPANSSHVSAPDCPTPCRAGPIAAATAAWVAVSTSSDSVAARVLELIGHGDDERFATFAGRAAAPRRVGGVDGGLVRRAHPGRCDRPVHRGRGGDRPRARHGRHRRPTPTTRIGVPSNRSMAPRCRV